MDGLISSIVELGVAELVALEDRHQRAGFDIEALFQIFVRSVNVGTMKNGHGCCAQNYHGNRQAKVKLYEPHAVDETLTRR